MATVSYKGAVRSLAEDLPVSFGFENNGQYFEFVPRSVFEKGVVKGDKQYYFPQVLSPGFSDSIGANAQYVEVQSIADQAGNKIKEDLKKSGFEDDRGYLFSMVDSDRGLTSWLDNNLNNFRDYTIGVEHLGAGGATYKAGEIQGLGTTPDGRRAFSTNTTGNVPNAQGYIQYNPETNDSQWWTSYYDPGKKPSWAKPLTALGYGLIGLGTFGLAGLGPLAAGGAGAGAGAGLGTGLTAGAGGATGLTAGAAGTTGLVAPAGFSFAPGIGAAGAGIAAGSQLGTGITPGAAGQGLQLPTAPGLSEMGGGTGLLAPVEGGTVSQLGFIPAGATPVLGDPKSFINDPNVLGQAVLPTQATGISATDALRLANQARGLLGAGQNPAVQQGMPGQQAGQRGAVDYSGVLGLLQQQARTPGVSSLTAPAQLMPRYQPTLLPNVLSLLG
jgi:hypothetical protein